ncbi:Aste57867_24254 [Aphanomyces stellatus]|uniref:phosphatidylinositol 3-kinase n=1 Tax=Aphanomyces stellatus TaxID=120398 RepID=A0A485LPW8_9STRA|nr:hypothetical protein As57867_024179 [Aphanomyces stellatus]VFU00894.1 Aste57867_24254 [Aphanomyces stellatus]
MAATKSASATAIGNTNHFIGASTNASMYHEYRYYLSSAIDCEVMFFLSAVDLPPGKLTTDDAGRATDDPASFPPQNLHQMLGTTSELRNSPMSELFVTAQIFADGIPMHPMLIHTKYPSQCKESMVIWNEWLTLPMKFKDLPRNAVIALTLWGVGQAPIGGTTMPIFAKDGRMKDGVQCLRVWPDVAADPQLDTTTPSDFADNNDTDDNVVLSRQMECLRLDKAREKYERWDMPRNEWMDRVTARRISRIRRSSEFPGPKEDLPSFCSLREEPCLWIDLPYFGQTVVYEEEPYAFRNAFGFPFGDGAKAAPVGGANGGVVAVTGPTDLPMPTPSGGGGMNKLTSLRLANDNETTLMPVWDPDLNEENPAERKYRKLARDILRGSIDPNLKPSREEKFAIEALLSSSKDHLKNDEKDLLWKFRYTLVENRRAIVKFLLSVDWLDENEVTLTTELLHAWCDIDIADALKLLGPRKEFKNDVVRKFAVAALAKSRNDDLLDFLLQLVQAMRYEKFSKVDNQLGPLARFLVSRACANFKMANYFYWYLQVELSDRRDGEMFQHVLHVMMEEMKLSEDGQAIYNMLTTQNDYMTRIMASHLRARDERGRRDQKEEKLRTLFKQLPWPKGVHIRLPSDPSIHLSGLVGSSAKMFKSAMYPCVVDFTTVLPEHDILEETEATSLRESLAVHHVAHQNSLHSMGRKHREKDGPVCKVMIKNGDDLRQDQLIMQLIILMDRLLKKVNLDLKLTPYRVLATSPTAGLMEFVGDSLAFKDVISNYKTVQNFLKTHNPDPNGWEGISVESINTYVKSLAGYCVITYILGIGDRHLDNLMMKHQGHLFHIDFGFVFGSDPKPFPPPFKLTKEMVEGMGGRKSENYSRFKTYCCQAYNWLRKSASMIMSLLNLMIDAGIPELQNDPHTTLAKVGERFRLDMSDEQAEAYFLGLISDSVTALFPIVVDVIHNWAGALK